MVDEVELGILALQRRIKTLETGYRYALGDAVEMAEINSDWHESILRGGRIINIGDHIATTVDICPNDVLEREDELKFRFRP